MIANMSDEDLTCFVNILVLAKFFVNSGALHLLLWRHKGLIELYMRDAAVHALLFICCYSYYTHNPKLAAVDITVHIQASRWSDSVFGACEVAVSKKRRSKLEVSTIATDKKNIFI